jgi:DNA-binding transcriptional LysR family regulator
MGVAGQSRHTQLHADRIAFEHLRMEFAQLRAILALRELASLAKAGEHLHLSPSAVFCQIRQLEDELGQKLYERVGNRLRLTGTGELLAQHAAKLVAAHDAAIAALKAESTSRRELLRLGCGPHSSQRVIPHLLRAFLSRHPETDIRLTTAGDQALLGEARLGVLDGVFMSLPVGDSELSEEPLWSYEMVLVLPPAKSGLYPKPRITDLRKAPFIMYRRAVVIDAAYQQLCRDIGFEMNVVMENDEQDSIKELVKLGLGITFLPLWSVADEKRAGTLRLLRLPRPQFHNYGLLYRKTDYRPKVLSCLLQVAHAWSEWWPLATHVSAPRV